MSAREASGSHPHAKVANSAMRSRPRFSFSIARLMGLIALFAVELALFQRVWLFIVMIPPVTIGIVSLNLAILYALKWLPKAMAGRIDGILCGGMIALFLLVGYYLSSSPRSWPLGWGGIRFSHWLADPGASLADPASPQASLLPLAARLVLPAEIVILDVLGLLLIWGGGWVAGRRHTGPVAPAAAPQEAPSPLDDGSVAPL